MNRQSDLTTLVIAAALLFGTAGSSHAHGGAQYGQGAGPGMAGPMMGYRPGCPYAQSQGTGPGMMGPYGGQGMGPGMMGPYGQGGGMGPGMRGQGMGPGMMGPYGQGRGMGYGQGRGMGPGAMMALPQDLSVDNVRHMLEHQLAWQGNPNLKLGTIEEQDEDTIIAEIVTQDGSLVQRLEVDRHTGRMQPAG